MISRLSAVWVLLVVLASTARAGVIHDAVRNGDTERVVSVLSSNPAAINERDADGRTPLHWACRRDDPDLAALLIDRGADIDATDKYGDTPVTLSAWRGYREFVYVVLDRGATVPEAGEKAPLLLA